MGWWMQLQHKTRCRGGTELFPNVLSHGPCPFWETQCHSPWRKGILLMGKAYFSLPPDLYSRSAELGSLR